MDAASVISDGDARAEGDGNTLFALTGGFGTPNHVAMLENAYKAAP
jgi:hypothetical protein